MGIFDKLKNTAQQAVVSAVQSAGNKRETFTFSALPESLAEMQALPEASLDTPFQAAALTVLALCAYAADKNIGTEMLNWLRGPRPLNGMEISFLNDRFRDGKTYLPFTYFAGSTPENNYTPSEPYTIVVESNHVSAEEQGYMKLFIPCGGADDPRPIKLRQRGSDGKWFLWEQYLLTGVRHPKRQILGHKILKIGSAALRTLFLQQSECFYSPTGTEAAPKSLTELFENLVQIEY